MNRVQIIRGNTAWSDSFIGNDGELTFDTQAKELRLHDGVTPGGHRVPNVNTIPTLSRKLFSTVATETPGNLMLVDMDRLINLNGTGDYVLPDRGTIDIGLHVILFAMSPGVVVRGFAANQKIADRGASAETRSMNQFETLHLACLTTAAGDVWRVITSY